MWLKLLLHTHCQCQVPMLANLNMQAFYFTTLAGIYGSTTGNDKHNSYYQPMNFVLVLTVSLSETPPPPGQSILGLLMGADRMRPSRCVCTGQH